VLIDIEGLLLFFLILPAALLIFSDFNYQPIPSQVFYSPNCVFFFMDKDTIVRIITEKGLKNVNLSMFSEQDRREIMEKVAEIYLRIGKTKEFLELLEFLDTKKYSEVMKKHAENIMLLGDYETAAMIYEKIGEKLMADTIRENFLK